MPNAKKSPSTSPVRGKRPIEQYTHDQETRTNNPPVGLVDAASDSPKTDILGLADLEPLFP